MRGNAIKLTSLLALAIAALACGSSGSGGATTAGGGGAGATSGSGGAGGGADKTPPGSCAKPGDKGNSKGVGTYCTPGGGQCSMFAEAGLCLADVGQDQWFCSRIGCKVNADCGEAAYCHIQMDGSGCVPNKCGGAGGAGGGGAGGAGGAGMGGAGMGGAGMGGAGTGGAGGKGP